VTPMFPLGVVHFPGVALPLRVFEPRYRQLTADCLQDTREFGVVLIERGSEVGGGDVRTDVGTMTSIVEAGIDASGMIHLATVGTRRIRVIRWLDDDPYPRADVEDLPPPPEGDPAPTERKVRRALALKAELEEPAAPHDVALDDDPIRRLFQLAAVAPLGPLDHQRLLASDDPLALLDRMMDEEVEVLETRLALG
jgi:Lon protease-like protein